MCGFEWGHKDIPSTPRQLIRALDPSVTFNIYQRLSRREIIQLLEERSEIIDARFGDLITEDLTPYMRPLPETPLT